MDVSARSFPTTAIAALSAATLALTPSVVPTVAGIAHPAVQLTSAEQLFSPGLLPSAPPDVVDAAVLGSAAAVAGSFGADIEAFYNAVEPWAAYGVNLLSWAVGWVPVAGLLAPQLNFFYDLGEPIVQSTLFNTVDLLSGTVSLAEALSNISTATTDAFNYFVTSEIDWIDSMLPPLAPTAADVGALADVGTLFGLIP
jgi:hypothetical protein